MPLPNRVDPFGELFATPARGTMFGNRGGRFHTDAKTLTKRRFVSRAWICCVLAIQEPPARRLGALLHRAVLPRRGDRARRRSSALLRMPPQGCRGVRRAVGRGLQAQIAAARRRHGRRAASRAPRRPRQAPAPARHRRSARRCRCCDWRAPSRCAATRCCNGRPRLCRAQAAPARRHGRGPHTARDPRGACGRLPAAMASERRKWVDR